MDMLKEGNRSKWIENDGDGGNRKAKKRKTKIKTEKPVESGYGRKTDGRGSSNG